VNADDAVDPLSASISVAGAVLTRADVSAMVRSKVLEVLEGFVKSDRPPCPEVVSRAVMECAREALPSTVRLDVVQISEEEKLVREVMEEPVDTIEIRATIPVSMEYIVMTLNIP
jgi:hypothetical protein